MRPRGGLGGEGERSLVVGGRRVSLSTAFGMAGREWRRRRSEGGGGGTMTGDLRGPGVWVRAGAREAAMAESPVRLGESGGRSATAGLGLRGGGGRGAFCGVCVVPAGRGLGLGRVEDACAIVAAARASVAETRDTNDSREGSDDSTDGLLRTAGGGGGGGGGRVRVGDGGAA